MGPRFGLAASLEFVFLRSFYADSSSPQISAKLVGHFTLKHGSLPESPQKLRTAFIRSWLAKFPSPARPLGDFPARSFPNRRSPCKYLWLSANHGKHMGGLYSAPRAICMSMCWLLVCRTRVTRVRLPVVGEIPARSLTSKQSPDVCFMFVCKSWKTHLGTCSYMLADYLLTPLERPRALGDRKSYIYIYTHNIYIYICM